MNSNERFIPRSREAVRLISTAPAAIGQLGISPGQVVDCTRALATDLIRSGKFELAQQRERFAPLHHPDVFGL